ncbi:unnamed protein product [Hermetia illucens]|uniref:RING finger protein 141 n=1 Tax=Hermetia illucens TaxID=343691 RepID=A0A7R8YY74_HERIL|nr:RING finger protein 141-like [Hermetia illucens]CAD7089793.1 unnamed protein product [Hermetia illucens]
MGQTQSITENLIPNTLDTVQFEVIKHARVLSEIGQLSYEDFQKCLQELNELSRKCLDSGGKQLVFLVKKGTDTSVLWKATVKIACVKVDPVSRQIDSYKFLNLKQFLCVFKTFKAHLDNLVSSEEHRERHYSSGPQCLGDISASVLMNQATDSSSISSDGSSCSTPQEFTECSICLDRKTEVLLPCAHTFCVPCIEQWNVNNKTCPICCEELATTDDTWVMAEAPGANEISDKICDELMSLSKNNTS